jgi:hypothetical protein
VCQAQQKAREQELLEIGGDGDDALSSFDPYSTGVYKGVTVGTAGAATERVVEVPHCILTRCCVVVGMMMMTPLCIYAILD